MKKRGYLSLLAFIFLTGISSIAQKSFTGFNINTNVNMLKLKRSNKSSVEKWTISCGVSVNNITVKANKLFNIDIDKFETSFSPLLSVGRLVPVGRQIGKYFIYPQLKLFRYKNTGGSISGPFIKQTTYGADLMILLEVNGGINLLNKENIQFFIYAGGGIAGQVKGRQEQQLYSRPGSPYGDKKAHNLPSLTYSINASTGVVLNKKIMITAGYLVPAPIGSFIEYTPRLSAFQLRLGYMLK